MISLPEEPPSPDEDNIFSWTAVIIGSVDTPFEDGIFCLTLKFSEEYPNKPPVVKFTTKMFHPNIYQDGSICLDILKERWSPSYDVTAILTSIQSLLSDPNPNSPANSMAAQLFKVGTDNQTSLKWYSTIAVLSGTLAPAGTFLKNNDKICPVD